MNTISNQFELSKIILFILFNNFPVRVLCIDFIMTIKSMIKSVKTFILLEYRIICLATMMYLYGEFKRILSMFHGDRAKIIFFQMSVYPHGHTHIFWSHC